MRDYHAAGLAAIDVAIFDVALASAARCFMSKT